MHFSGNHSFACTTRPQPLLLSRYHWVIFECRFHLHICVLKRYPDTSKHFCPLISYCQLHCPDLAQLLTASHGQTPAETCRKPQVDSRICTVPNADEKMKTPWLFLRLLWGSEGNLRSPQVSLLLKGNSKSPEHLLFQTHLHRHSAIQQVQRCLRIVFPNTISERSIFSLWRIAYMVDSSLTSGWFICNHWDLSKQNCCKGYLNPECHSGIKCSLLWLSFLVWNVQILRLGVSWFIYWKAQKWKESIFLNVIPF